MNKNSIFYAVLFLVVALSGCDTRNSYVDEYQFDVICLDGHQYWVRGTTFSDKGYLSIRLDDDGKPLKCDRARYRPGGNRL